MITIASMVFVSGGTIGILHIQAKELARRLQSIEDQMKQLTQILINQATQGVRLDTMDQRLNAQGRRLDEVASRVNTIVNKDGNR